MTANVVATKTKTPDLTTSFPPEPSGYLHLWYSKVLYNNYIFL
jgi:glutamyl/glutaminyl-tRNA synthetase